MTKLGNRLFLAVIGLADLRPFRPRIVGRSCIRRFRHHLNLSDTLGAQTDGCSGTVISRITATDDNDILAFYIHKLFILKIGIQETLGCSCQEINSKIDSFGISSRILQVTWIGGAAAENDSVEVFQKLICLDGLTDVCVGDKFDTFLFHHFHFSVNDAFFQFHIRNTIAKQSSDTVSSLKYRYVMTTFVELICRCQTGWAASYDCHLFAGTHSWWFCLCIASLVSSLNDCIFIFFCRDSFSIQIAGAGFLTQCRTHSGSKLRKAVCLCQSLVCHLPVSVVYKIIPLWNQVVQRTAGGHSADHHTGLAERNPARHTSCALKLLLFQGEMLMEFVKMFDSVFWFFCCCSYSLIV